jgi:hypothetical protein
MSDGAFIVICVVLAGWLALDVVWSRYAKRARDLDAEHRRAALLREVRRHGR